MKFNGEFITHSRADELDDLECEALAVTYQPPSQGSAESDVQRFPLDESLLDAMQEIQRRVREVVIDVHAYGKSDARFFRRGLRKPLL